MGIGRHGSNGMIARLAVAQGFKQGFVSVPILNRNTVVMSAVCRDRLTLKPKNAQDQHAAV